MTDAAAQLSTMRRDIASAYLVTLCRIGSWVVLSSFVYRFIGKEAFALFAFVRATLGILNYVTLGLAPAMVRELAIAHGETERVVHASGMRLAAWSAAVGAIAILVIAAFAMDMRVSGSGAFVFLFGVGMLLRLFSDPAGAVLQTRDYVWADNLLLALAELAWVAIVYTASMQLARYVTTIAWAYLVASLALTAARFALARVNPFDHTGASEETTSRLLRFGVTITVAQLADYLYAPTDYLLIRLLITPVTAISDYAPAVQIDAGLLLIVTAIATVLLPKSALAHAAGDLKRLRRYYIFGTTLSTAAVAAAAVVVYFLRASLFELWFHSPMPGTQAILPLVLIHTVVGGSSAVGRSILLGMGKVKPFTISVLIAGVTNVILSYCFVRFFDLGLRGIIYGTIVAVVGRCAIWMPWFVMKSLREAAAGTAATTDDATSAIASVPTIG